jgi:hypothetical protein
MFVAGFLLVGSALDSSAEQFGLFTYEVVGDTVEITDYPTNAVGDVEIPAEIDGKPVTSIANHAFRDCSGLTGVTIPEEVTTIGIGAFSRCSGLTEVILFPGGRVGDYIIPEGVPSIGSSAFSGCSGLTGVTIPEGVTTIGSSAFSGCGGLTGVTIPEGVTAISSSAFSGCTGLADVAIPFSVTSIDLNAFRECTSLTSVTIPEDVTSIGWEAFSGCTGLTSVTIPESVTTIGERAFSGCSGLTSILVQLGNPNYVSLGGVLFNAAQTEIILYPGGRVGAYTIPEGVTTLGNHAFYQCSGLTGVAIPSSVTTIGNGAFRNCTGLTSVTILEGVTRIGNYAFSECTGLNTAVFVGNSPINDGDYETYFRDTAPEFTIYYLSGSAGFTSPTWGSYPAVMIDEALYPATTSPISSISLTPDGLRLTLPPIILFGHLALPPTRFGRQFGVEYSPDLSPGSWIELGNFFPVEGLWVFTDPDRVRLARPSGYYRAFLRPIVP